MRAISRSKQRASRLRKYRQTNLHYDDMSDVRAFTVKIAAGFAAVAMMSSLTCM
jgi:hypothetical protein